MDDRASYLLLAIAAAALAILGWSSYWDSCTPRRRTDLVIGFFVGFVLWAR